MNNILYTPSKLNKHFFSTYYDKDTHVGTFERKTTRSSNVSTAILDQMDVTQKEDYYFSVNPIRNMSKRCTKNVIGLSWLFADLDLFHNGSTKYDHMTTEEVSAVILCSLHDEGIPHPTVMVSSGRGFYLLWKLTSSHDKTAKPYESIKALKRWKRLNRTLSERLKEFDADLSICEDPARLLRVPGTMNSAANARVNIIRNLPDLTYTLYDIDVALNGKDATDKQFAFLDAMEETLGYGPDYYDKRSVQTFIKKNKTKFFHIYYGQASDKQRAYCEALAKKLEIKLPKNTRWAYEADQFIQRYSAKLPKETKKKENTEQINSSSLTLPKASETCSADSYSKMYRNRLDVLFACVQSDPDQTGRREIMLFLCRYYACQVYGDPKEALECVLSLNQFFSEPLSRSEAVRATRSGETYFKTTGYKLTTESFCAKIGITPDQYYAFTGSRKKRTKSEQNRKEINHRYYMKKLQQSGKETKSTQVLARRKRVRKCMDQGMTLKEIADALQIAVNTIRRDLKAVMGDSSVRAAMKLAKRMRKEMAVLVNEENAEKKDEVSVSESLVNQELEPDWAYYFNKCQKLRHYSIISATHYGAMTGTTETATGESPGNVTADSELAPWVVAAMKDALTFRPATS